MKEEIDIKFYFEMLKDTWRHSWYGKAFLICGGWAIEGALCFLMYLLSALNR